MLRTTYSLPKLKYGEKPKAKFKKFCIFKYYIERWGAVKFIEKLLLFYKLLLYAVGMDCCFLF